MAFENLSLHPQLLKALADAGYNEPTEIQCKAIPKIIQGFDIRGSAQTGSGKTAAFLLPILHRLASFPPKQGKGPRVVILVPTRELAMQIAVQTEKYSKYLPNIKTVCVNGGVSYQIQMRKMARPYDILVATPGRLIDYIQQRKIDFPRVEMLVLDEADRMLDMGFLEPVEHIVSKMPKERQTLLFSATLKGAVIKLSEKLLNNPMDIIAKATVENQGHIEQNLYYADDLHHKKRLLEHILGKEEVVSTIVFTATKRSADQLVRELEDKGFLAAGLHGDMSQRQRSRTILNLREGKVAILVATDVAARGIDVPAISHVINFDIPRTSEDYVHRIGRTGRAGAKGIALSFVLRQDVRLVKGIEKFTGQTIQISEIAGLEAKPRSANSPNKGDYPPRRKTSFSRNRKFPRRKSF